MMVLIVTGNDNIEKKENLSFVKSKKTCLFYGQKMFKNVIVDLIKLV